MGRHRDKNHRNSRFKQKPVASAQVGLISWKDRPVVASINACWRWIFNCWLLIGVHAPLAAYKSTLSLCHTVMNRVFPTEQQNMELKDMASSSSGHWWQNLADLCRLRKNRKGMITEEPGSYKQTTTDQVITITNGEHQQDNDLSHSGVTHRASPSNSVSQVTVDIHSDRKPSLDEIFTTRERVLKNYEQNEKCNNKEIISNRMNAGGECLVGTTVQQSSTENLSDTVTKSIPHIVSNASADDSVTSPTIGNTLTSLSNTTDTRPTTELLPGNISKGHTQTPDHVNGDSDLPNGGTTRGDNSSVTKLQINLPVTQTACSSQPVTRRHRRSKGKQKVRSAEDIPVTCVQSVINPQNTHQSTSCPNISVSTSKEDHVISTAVVDGTEPVKPVDTPPVRKPSGSIASEVSVELNGEFIRPVGLVNLGNTCYFNAVMQNISQTPLLREELSKVKFSEILSNQVHSSDGLQDNWKVKLKRFLSPTAKAQLQHPESQTTSSLPLTQSLYHFYTVTAPNQKPAPYAVMPEQLFRKLCQRSTRFTGGFQQDSHECLRHLLDGIKEEAKAARTISAVDNPEIGEKDELTVVDKIFGGHYLTVFRCSECEVPYHLFEPFLDVSLPVAFSSGKIHDYWSKENTDNSSRVAQNAVQLNDPSTSSEPRGEVDRQISSIQHMTNGGKATTHKSEENHNEVNGTEVDRNGNNRKLTTEAGSKEINGQVEGQLVRQSVTPAGDMNSSIGSQQNIEQENLTADKAKDKMENQLGGQVEVSGEQLIKSSSEEDKSMKTPSENVPEAVKSDLEQDDQTSVMKLPQDQRITRSADDDQSQLIQSEKVRELADYRKYIDDITKRLAPVGTRISNKLTHRDSVLNSLRFFTRIEQLDEYLCLKCNEGRSDAEEPKMTVGWKQTLIFNPPAVLTVHLKRFEQTRHGYKKVEKPVAFELNLNLAPFCSHLALRRASLHDRGYLYSLYGVVVHEGTLEGGHYVAYVRVRSVNVEQSKVFLQERFFDRDALMGKDELIRLVKDLHSEGNKWQLHLPSDFSMNERSLSEWYYISDRHVQHVKRVGKILRQQAYLLFYERIHNKPITTTL